MKPLIYGFKMTSGSFVMNFTLRNVLVAVVTSGILNGKTIYQVAAGYDHSITWASEETISTFENNG